MDIYVRVKALGKHKDILAPTPYTIPDGIYSLRQLLTAVVQKEVAQYERCIYICNALRYQTSKG